LKLSKKKPRWSPNTLGSMISTSGMLELTIFMRRFVKRET
jgi:hypothetical protein